MSALQSREAARRFLIRLCVFGWDYSNAAKASKDNSRRAPASGLRDDYQAAPTTTTLPILAVNPLGGFTEDDVGDERPDGLDVSGTHSLFPGRGMQRDTTRRNLVSLYHKKCTIFSTKLSTLFNHAARRRFTRSRFTCRCPVSQLSRWTHAAPGFSGNKGNTALGASHYGATNLELRCGRYESHRFSLSPSDPAHPAAPIIKWVADGKLIAAFSYTNAALDCTITALSLDDTITHRLIHSRGSKSHQAGNAVRSEGPGQQGPHRAHCSERRPSPVHSGSAAMEDHLPTHFIQHSL